MSPAHIVLALASVVAFAAGISNHRYLGIFTIAASGVAVMYFLMDPVYTFRVAQTRDIGALGIYGVFGMLIVSIDQHRFDRRRVNRKGDAE